MAPTPPARRPVVHRGREGGEGAAVRLPDVRPVRAPRYRLLLPDDLPQAAPQRALRRGVPDGRCEVYPELRCVWVTAFERAEAAGHGADLDLLQRPLDHREAGRSSWVSYWQGRDEDLWVSAEGPAPRPLAAPGTAPGPPMTARAGLRAALAAGRFAVTAELGPPARRRPGAIAARRRCCADWVDAANVTDNQGAHVRHVQPGRLPARAAGGRRAGHAADRAATATGSRCSPTCSAPAPSASPTCCC